MVNENFKKFNQEQKKHLSPYISNKTLDNSGNFNKSAYNSQENTDKSVGETGRKIE